MTSTFVFLGCNLRRRVALGRPPSVLALAAVALCGLLTSASAMAIEEPAFERTTVEGANEVRRYAPMIVAETWVAGDLSDGSNDGFRVIARYIFGANRSRAGEGSERIAMTAPVTMEARSERIAMTAPVTMELPVARSGDAQGEVGAAAAAGEGRWRMHFVMPSRYTMATLPEPIDPRVVLREVPAQQNAARTFSGFVTNARVASEIEALRAWMSARGLQAAGPAQLARYNPPWSIPFLRRNEILIPLR
jgi:hypothetical protein